MTALAQVWLPPPADLMLSSGEIHIWRAFLDLPAVWFQRLQDTLSTDELKRAGRFYFQTDRQRFIVGRGLLRTILSRYLDVEPRQLHFGYNHYGKPALAPIPGQERLRFNLSHSDGLALFAVTRDREIGVDVERIRADFEYEQISERFFSSQEHAGLHALPAKMRPEAFFNCWTRKEAYIKARGEGLSLPLDQFDVSLAPSEPAMLLSIRGDPKEAAHWSLYELLPGPGYVAVLAVEGRGWRLKCLQLPELVQL